MIERMTINLNSLRLSPLFHINNFDRACVSSAMSNSQLSVPLTGARATVLDNAERRHALLRIDRELCPLAYASTTGAVCHRIRLLHGLQHHLLNNLAITPPLQSEISAEKAVSSAEASTEEPVQDFIEGEWK